MKEVCLRLLSVILNGCLLCGALTLTQPAFSALPQPVKTTSGLLQGIAGKNPKITAFRGVPYAAPPVGNLRWQAPRPAAPWKQVRIADHFGDVCMQNDLKPGSFYQVEFYQHPEPISENCLYLNVWTAASSPSEKRPVMVWLHGGGFVEGSGSLPSFDGEGLAAKGAVVVTINYRLGVFGFLALPALAGENSRHASGNYGLLDQLEALKWVKANISRFGGDPENVTVFGQSAGASAVLSLAASPLARGYFERGIVQSGGFIRGGGKAAAEENGKRFLERMGVQSIAELRKQSAQEIQKAAIPPPDGKGANISRFVPIVDGYFLPTPPLDVFRAGQQNIHSVLTGSNADEGTTFIPATLTAAQRKSQVESRYGARADAYLQQYPATTDQEAFKASTEAIRDAMANTSLEVARDAPAKKAWVYYFARHAPGRDSDHYGAFHSAELVYVFNNLDSVQRPWTETDRKLADAMSSYWVNFARTGDPNAGALPHWPAFGTTTARGLVLGEEIKPGTLPPTERLDTLKKEGFDSIF